MNIESEWTRVLIYPLGLVGFSLSLVFGLLARSKKGTKRRWPLVMAFLMAGVAILSSVALAFLQTTQTEPIQKSLDVTPQHSSASTPVPQGPTHRGQHNRNIRQTSHGPNSPNIQGVQGNVTVTLGETDAKNRGKDEAVREHTR